MPRVLNRPMFKRGGNTSSKNKGIVSGFEDGGRVRQNYAKGDYVRSMMPYLEEPEYQQGLTRSDWLRIAAAGMEIMGAPASGRGGLTGALQAASPALAGMGKDLAGAQDARYTQYLDARRQHNEVLASAALEEVRAKQEQENKMKQLKKEGEIQGDLLTQQGVIDLAKISDQGDIDIDKIQETGVQDRLTNKQRIFEIDRQFEYYKEARDDWSAIWTERDALDKSSDDYKTKYDKLTVSLQEAGMRMRGALQLRRPDGQVIGDYTMMELSDVAKKLALGELGLDVEPSIEDDYEFYLRYLDIYFKHLEAVSDKHLKATTEADILSSYKHGGRVGLYAGGTTTIGDEGVDATGPVEPGPNPDPNQPPIMQSNVSPLSYEELRARLPMEVSDDVVRLLATSEQALIDFAQIETQDDIARFNQKYNADLMLPTQQAV
jgi:hypothetical protein